jgi:hypothetical protein
VTYKGGGGFVLVEERERNKGDSFDNVSTDTGDGGGLRRVDVVKAKIRRLRLAIYS